MKVQIVIFKSMSPVVKGLTKILHAMVSSLRAHTVCSSIYWNIIIQIMPKYFSSSVQIYCYT